MSTFNKSLHEKRQKQHREIRRQYIETFTKNRRKQLMQENESFFKNKHHNAKQAEYQEYFSSLSSQSFRQDPNSHLQFLVEMLLSQQKSNVVRRNLSEMLIIVHEYMIKVFVEQRGKIDYLIGLIRQSKLKQCQDLVNPLIVDILVYNSVYFQPLYGSRQHKYSQSPQPSHYQSNTNLNQCKSNPLVEVTNKKLNIYLLLDFFMAIIYQITPSIFVSSRRQKASNKIMDNGYDLLVNSNKQINNNNTLTVNYNNDSPYISQFITILNDIYKMTLTLFKITLHFRYQIHSLQKLSSLFNHLYNNIQSNQPILQTNILPILWFDKQRMFMKQSVKSKISGRCLHIIVNITALLSMDKQLDNMIHSWMILNQIDALAQDNGFTRQEISQLINLYSNLIDEEISYVYQKKDAIHKGVSQIEEEYSNEYILQQPPGIYVFLLEMIAENAESQEQIGNVVYIIKVILESYQVPNRQENMKMVSDREYLKAENSQLILSLYHAQAVAQILSTLFSRITENQYQIPHLSALFIQVTQKMLTYLLYLHQLPEILQLVIKNQNKRMFQIHSKCHSTLNSIVSQTQEKQKSIVTQNLKQILVNTKQVLKLFTQEYLSKSSKSQVDLQYINEAIPKDLIDCIIQLWQQNQIQYCYNQFLQFICIAVQYFPQYMILTDSKERNQHFLDLIDQIPSNSTHLNQTNHFLQILQLTLHYIRHYDSKLTPKNSLSKYFIDFKTNWTHILQHLEGLMYDINITSKENQIHSETIQQLYQNINSLLKSALQNMQIEI